MLKLTTYVEYVLFFHFVLSLSLWVVFALTTAYCSQVTDTCQACLILLQESVQGFPSLVSVQSPRRVPHASVEHSHSALKNSKHIFPEIDLSVSISV